MNIRWSPALIAAASISPGVRMQIQAELEVERAVFALAVVTPPHAAKVVNAEVQRRHGDLRMSKAASCESVRDDLISGRWNPDTL